ncbi:hypothetical protein GCM10007913_32210 [Devosia yakushimensis]|uniref:Uncharacterized protein n=1 Tax=Devosia yakushimensis TaxID=470028 RepID=A0ABQ5UJI3_9HYPH|nr:hypothetical protein [Devosia yakushimensis]GLQ11289.1 hypothetical protein GCM10007913_32210 [Devosia yakushimensis]
MGPYRAQIAALALLLVSPALAQEPGWHYSPLPGEGDRATLGCARDGKPEDFACLAVRCEDDFTTGVHIHTSDKATAPGLWDITIDREVRTLVAEPALPYGGKFVADGPWLLERLAQGAYVYLQKSGERDAPVYFIDLTGSLFAINTALAFCAPRLPRPGEPNAGGDV